jgi:hypothetical protein
MTPAQSFAERRQLLRGRVPGGLVLLLGNGESPMNYQDNTYPFRQDSTFLYFTGLDRPGLALILGLDVHDLENLGERWVGCEGQPKSTQFGLKALRLARPCRKASYSPSSLASTS